MNGQCLDRHPADLRAYRIFANPAVVAGQWLA